MMPSSLNATDIIHLGVEDLAAQELELRKGQANDALERLRLALANKALLWRTKVHAANTTKKGHGLGLISKRFGNRWNNMSDVTTGPAMLWPILVLIWRQWKV